MSTAPRDVKCETLIKMLCKAPVQYYNIDTLYKFTLKHVSNEKVNVKHMYEIIEYLIKCKQYNKAVDVFVKMYECKKYPNVQTHTLIIATIFKTHCYENVYDIFLDMKKAKIYPTRTIYNYVLQALVFMKRYNDVFDIAQQMERYNVYFDITAYNILLRNCATANKFELALNIFKNMNIDADIRDMISCNMYEYRNFCVTNMKTYPDTAPNKETYNIIMDILTEIGNKEFTMLILMKLGETVSKHIYNKVLSLCQKLNDIQLTNYILNDMEKKNKQPNVKTYNILLNIYYNCKKYDLVIKIFKELYEKQMNVNVNNYTIIINACEKIKDPETAICVYNIMKMNTHYIDIYTYNMLINVCEKTEQYDLSVHFSNLLDSEFLNPILV